MIKILKEEDFNVFELRPKIGKFSILQSVHYRVNASNSNNCSLLVSIHGGTYEDKGCQVVMSNKDKKLEKLSYDILGNISKLGFFNKGIKFGSHLYIMKYSNAKSIVINVCSINNEEDMELYNKTSAKDIASAIAEGIKNYCK